ncbi:hypothetical protein GLAREA_08499 [Glarea lozoyensis ATCC 20868]|uniref:Uncharacterized protein n=1 Tax=Glarea lozoyensis (strain ATCC 20868 / MF5171) TaxID=1116229 RepID=S3CXT3_GLAL2|nr:uncharacterized protein GLAREA_08499 [Glarea lozoyensis ATCC 20868]EPE24646.1 hypothetical protein GLAREA_08499 [Glarea lozoyensis ATCC 20868]
MSTAQLSFTNDGCSTYESLQISCSSKFPEYRGRHTSPPLSVQACVCYDNGGAYKPEIFEGGVSSCYSALNELPATAFTDDIYMLNSNTAFPSLFSAVFNGFCSSYATYGAAPTPSGFVSATKTREVSTETCPPGRSCNLSVSSTLSSTISSSVSSTISPTDSSLTGSVTILPISTSITSGITSVGSTTTPPVDSTLVPVPISSTTSSPVSSDAASFVSPRHKLFVKIVLSFLIFSLVW